MADSVPASHRVVTLLGGLAFSGMGMNTAVISFAVLGMRAEWQLSPREVSLVIASAAIGQLAGSIVLGHLADRLGRRGMYVLGVALLGGFTALAALAPYWLFTCGFLFLAGLGQGGATPVVTAMVAEAAPTTSRGRMVATIELMFAAGWTVAAFLGRALAQGSNWHFLMAIGSAPLLLAPLGLWLLASDRPAHQARFAQPRHGVATLWRPAFRTETAMLWLVWFAIFSMWFGPVVWLPTLFASAGDPDPAGKGSLVAIAMLVSAVIVLAVIDHVGRRRLVIPGLIVMAGACAALGFAPDRSWLVPAGVLLGLAGQSVWPVCLTYAAEIYPTAFRALGVGWALGAGRFGAMLAPLGLGALLAWQGQTVALLPFCALTAAAALFAWLAGPETAGRDLDSAIRVG